MRQWKICKGRVAAGGKVVFVPLCGVLCVFRGRSLGVVW